MSTQFVIVGAPRTGSTLLVKTLNSLDGVCCHGELLGADQVRGYEDGADLINMTQQQRTERLQRLLRERSADPVGFIHQALDRPSAAAGFKALYSAFLDPRWQDVVDSLLKADSFRFIHLTRTNTLRRFVSEQILLQGGPNHSGAGGRSEQAIAVTIDIDEFLQRSAELENQAAALDALLSARPVFKVHYETLAAETAETVAQVCDFLGLDVDAATIQPALKKVGASNLQKVVRNYQQLLDHPATRVLALAD
ncbi:MAG: sulfotransferase [Halioglobus sp.]|nr:sulfotransferase [Halioglobus sp.]